MPIKCTPASAFKDVLAKASLKRTVFGGLGAAMLSSPRTWIKNILFTEMNRAVNRAVPFASAALQKIPGVKGVAEKALGGAIEERSVEAATIGLMAHMSRLGPLLRRHDMMGKIASASQDLVESALGASRVGARELLQEKGGSGIAPGIRQVSEAVFSMMQRGDEALFRGEVTAQVWTRAAQQARSEGKKGIQSVFNRASEIIEAETKRTTQAKTDLFEAAADELRKKNPRVDMDNLTEDFTNRLNAQFRQGEQGTLTGISIQEAERNIFVAREGAWLDRALDMADELDESLGGIVSAALPFRRTPTNEIREFFRQTPGGLFTVRRRMDQISQQLKDAGVQNADLIARSMAFDEIARVAVGTSTLVGAFGLVSSGFASVNPFDRNKTQAQRATELAAGERTDTLQWGDWQVPLRNLGLAGRYMKVAQNMRDAVDAEDGTALSRAGEAARSLMLDTSFGIAKEGGLDDLVKMIESWGDPGRMAAFARDFGGRFNPAIVRDIQRALGKNRELTDVDREASAFAAFGEGVVGAFGAESEGTTPRLDVFGRARQTVGGPFGTLTGATKPPTTRQTDFAKVLLGAGAPKEPPEGRVTGVDLSFQQKNAVAQARGRLREKLMISRVGLPGTPRRQFFDRLSPAARKKILDKVFRDAGRQIGDVARVMARAKIPITTATLTQRLRLPE